MQEVPEGTNQGTPILGDPYAFPYFGNVGPPMMATLNLLRFTVRIVGTLYLCNGNVDSYISLSSTRTYTTFIGLGT